MNLVMFTKKDCRYCVKLADLLKDLEIKFSIAEVDENPSRKEFLVGLGFTSVPQLFEESCVEGLHSTRHIGDYSAIASDITLVTQP